MIENLQGARYLSLGTRRKNGAIVRTPVWFAEWHNALYVFSAGDAGKVKRLRNFSDVEVAPCDVRGRIKGDFSAAQALLVGDDAEESDAAYRALRRKYGLQMCLLDLASCIGGKINKRQLIRIEQ